MTYEVEPAAVSLRGDVMNVPLGTVIDASVRTSKCGLRGICAYRTPPVEFVVTSQTVVEESQLAPALNGDWTIWGGCPEIETWTFSETGPTANSTSPWILTRSKRSC